MSELDHSSQGSRPMSASYRNSREMPSLPTSQSRSYISRILHSDPGRDNENRRSTFRRSFNDLTKPCIPRRPCYDWIFSSASNAHVAIDRSTFKTYTYLNSYVLTISGHRQIPVHGIGSVDLDLRRKKGNRKCHTITLENVLHIPTWMCNIFSDIYFEAEDGQFEHTWDNHGVQFMNRKDGEKMRTWGYTEEFCGLDRLSLARNTKGRSPMLEDAGREVFSVNVTWPQGQKDRWEKTWRAQSRRSDDRFGYLKEKEIDSGMRNETLVAQKG